MELSKKLAFIGGFALSSILFFACSATFPYRFYNYDIEHHKLLGDKPADDLPDSSCVGVSGHAYPCTVMQTSEFYKLKADYEKAHQDLQDCQNGPHP